MGRDFILEIGTEEIPARFMPGALQQFKEKALELLKSNRVAFGEVETFGTPRAQVPLSRIWRTYKKIGKREKGPSKTQPLMRRASLPGQHLVAEKQGVAIEQLELERSGKKEYLVAVQKIPGKKTPELLSELLPSLIKSIVFPKNMIWEQSRARFARPIRWLLCLFGEELVAFSYAGVSSGRETRGHCFINPVLCKQPRPLSLFGEAVLFSTIKGLMIREKVERYLIRRRCPPGHRLAAGSNLSGGNPEAILALIRKLSDLPGRCWLQPCKATRGTSP